MADYESVLCVKNEVFVYHIPARTSNRGYRAADWKLDEPNWTGRLKVVSKNGDLTIRLEDRNSGELFAQCPIESYPSASVEQVLDSSRYFVIRIQDGVGRAAFIGLGFADRGDSFDLMVALQDHFKQVKREEAVKHEQASGVSQLDAGPKLDLGFKEGQTITINLATRKSSGESLSTGVAKQRPRGPAVGVSPLLPPPPGAGTRVIANPKPSPAFITQTGAPTSGVPTFNSQPVSSGVTASSHSKDLLLDIGSPVSSTSHSASTSGDLFGSDWGNIMQSASSSTTNSQPVPDQNWVNFD